MATDEISHAVSEQAPYAAQDVQEIAALVKGLESATGGRKTHGFSCKKTRFAVAGSPDGAHVDSWRFQDWDYKRRDLPTYARGLFTTRNRNKEPEIVIRGYDKFFNTDEVHETKWGNILSRTQGPYELTLKENGCIIFVSGLEDETLLVCSKHSTGARSDVELSHAMAGERSLERQLEKMGKTKQDLARDLRSRNATAVAELCDDSFEEHILAYGPEKAGLYLHGINLNLPDFATYPSSLVTRFADEWGFRKVAVTYMDDINVVKTFLETVAETGAHEGRDVEGFVIRCKMSHNPQQVPYTDWFFKFKFEEPYLMYRQWRECTKALISGKPPKYKKHAKITEEYLLYARKRLAADPKLGKLYNQNHGIIKLRDDFLSFKNLKGSDAAAFEEEFGTGNVKTEVTKDVILVPIATLGCGKTTVAVALTHLFGWGHVQNDNITGKGRPPRFTRMLLEQLDDQPVVVADRNNSARHERKQLITDVKIQHREARLVALNWVHDNLDDIRRVTRERVLARGDGHQTIQAASDPNKVIGIMDGFIQRFEPCNSMAPPDDGFDSVIDLDPVADSRKNLETIVRELHRMYPNLVTAVPSAEALDGAIKSAMDEYQPELRHTIPGRKENQGATKQASGGGGKAKKKALEYMSIEVPAKEVNALLEKAFKDTDAKRARFYTQLQKTRRVQPRFHVTLMHRATAKEHPTLWEWYTKLHTEAEAKGVPDGKLGEVEVMFERVVFDSRIMAIVVRIVQPEDRELEWKCVNKVAHVTVGTRDDQVKPKESNDLLARWLEKGSGDETGISDVLLEGKPCIKGTAKGVLSR